MKRFGNLLISFVLIALMFACTKEGSDIIYSTNNEHIKSISMDGKIVHKYLYDHTGKIVEENSFSYYKKYIYGDNERLVKIESAFDWRGASSSAMPVPKTEFMTSQNSPMNNYTLYEYDKTGRLSKTEFYSNFMLEKFELRSTWTYEYKGSNIVKVNVCDETGKSIPIYVYAYDKKGNVINEKYYSNAGHSDSELISETSYKYDNYKNPFRIFIMSGSPGMNTNVNNIIETSVIRHYEVSGLDKYSTEKRSYEYNSNSYPVKAFISDNVEEYAY